MVREVSLLLYLPQFIQEYKEIKHIMNVENPEIQSLEDETEFLKDNQFILYCNEDGISRFEKLLGIKASADDTLKSRISRVTVRWNDTIPYTWKVLMQKLNTICGAGNYELLADFDNYTLTVKTHLNLYGATDDLDNILDYMIPCNLVVISQNELDRPSVGTMGHVGVVANTKEITIESKVNKEHSVTAVVSVKNNVTTSRHRTI